MHAHVLVQVKDSNLVQVMLCWDVLLINSVDGCATS